MGSKEVGFGEGENASNGRRSGEGGKGRDVRNSG